MTLVTLSRYPPAWPWSVTIRTLTGGGRDRTQVEVIELAGEDGHHPATVAVLTE